MAFFSDCGAKADECTYAERSCSRGREAIPEKQPAWLDSLFTRVQHENKDMLEEVCRDNANTIGKIEKLYGERMGKSEQRIAGL